MKAPDGFRQSYNAQAAVEIKSRLPVGVNVSDAPTHKGQLVPTLAAERPVIERILVYTKPIPTRPNLVTLQMGIGNITFTN
jgi:hypothetical protein